MRSLVIAAMLVISLSAATLFAKPALFWRCFGWLRFYVPTTSALCRIFLRHVKIDRDQKVWPDESVAFAVRICLASVKTEVI